MKSRVVKALNKFLEITERRQDGKTKLLLSFERALKEIASSTLFGWDMKVLELANIGTSVLMDIPLDQPLFLK